MKFGFGGRKMFGPCEAENGTQIDELLAKPEHVGTKEHGKMIKHNSDSRRTAGFLPKRQEIGRLKDKQRRMCPSVD